MEPTTTEGDGMTKWERRWHNLCFPILAGLLVFVFVGIGWGIGTKQVMDSNEYKLGKVILDHSNVRTQERPYTITIY